MVKLNAENLGKFLELLEEEHTIHTNLIPTIYDILIEATGYVEEEAVDGERNKLSKKEKNILRSKQRAHKEKLKSV